MDIRVKRAILYMLAILFVAVNAAIFLRSAKNEREQLMSTPPPQQTQTPVGAVSAATNTEASGYVVIAENGYLNLYPAGSAAPEKSVRFDIGLFPAEDAKLLAEGVEFDTIEQAYEFMESFVS